MKFTDKKLDKDKQRVRAPEVPENSQSKDKIPRPMPMSQDRPGGEIPLTEHRPHRNDRRPEENVDAYP